MASSFQCPRCGQLLPTANSAAGSARVTCTACQATLYLPQIAASADAEKPNSNLSTGAVGGDFRMQCEKCGKLIRVPAHLAGRNGACPQCKQVFRIPALTAAAANNDDVILPLDDIKPPSAAVPTTPYPTPHLTPPTTPYSMPVATPYPASASAPQPGSNTGPTYLMPTTWQMPSHSTGVGPKSSGESLNVSFITITKACGVIMMVVAGLNGLVLFLSFSFVVLRTLNRPDVTPAKFTRNRVTVTTDYLNTTSVAAVVLVSLAGIGMLGGTMFGGYQMYMLQSWAWALAASILSIVPCVVFTSVVGIPAGVVGIVMLSNPAVRSQFASIR